MKKLFTLLLFVLGAGLLSTEKVQASHCQGADLTYAYTGNPNEYLVTLRFYRDCFGINAPTVATICYSSANAGLSQTLDLFPIPGTGQPIPNSLCIIVTGNCAGGVGTEEWIYQGTVVLPSSETDWIFGYELCCRNVAITTLQNPSGVGIFVSTYLDNLNYPTNSSPVFSSIPVTVFCVNNQFFYPQGATDVDGDSLHYTLVTPEDASGFCPYTPTTLLYVSPYTPTNPLSTATGTTLDPNTGLISFTPNLVQVAVICVLVEEFDTSQVPAVKKGSVKRDLQVLITQNCNVIQPFPTAIDTTVINGTTYTNVIYANCADTSVIVTLDQTVQCGSIAADGSDFRAIRPNGQPNPIFQAEAVNCINGQTDSVRVYFYFPLTQVRTALYIKKGTDGNTMLSECGNSIYETDGTDTTTINDTISIIVQDTSVIDLKLPVLAACVFNQFTIHFFDQMLCATIKPNGTDFQLVDANGTVFPVSSAYGNCVGSPSSYTQDITVVMANTVVGVSPFYVISLVGGDNNTLANFCETYINVGDTIAIIDASQPLLFTLGPDINQCINDPVPVLNSQLTGLTYTWTFNGSTLTNDTTQFLTATQPGVYTVNVFATAGCQGADTINVSFIVAPVSDILANGTPTNAFTICQGSPYPLLDGTDTAASSTYNWVLNGTSVSTSPIYTPTVDGTYILQVSSGGTCLGYDTITINTIANAVVNLGPPITQCSNIANPVLDAGGNTGATYLWSTGETTQTITAGATGAYTVTVTYGGICSASGTISVTINIVPASPALADETICYNVVPGTLNANPFGTQPATATYSWSNGTSVVSTASSYQPTAAGTYTVTIDNAGCTIVDDAVINIELQLIIDLGVDQSICNNAITLDPLVAGNIYQWTLNGGNIANTQSISATQPGLYTVLVTTPLGCTSTDNVTVNAGTFAPTITGDAIICETSSSNLDAGVSVGGGDAYAWSTGATTQQISANQTNAYVVSITNQFGCIGKDTFNVSVERVLDAPVPTCASSSSGTFKYIYTWTAVAGAAGYEVSVDGGATWITPNAPVGITSHGVNEPAASFLVHALGTFCPLGKNSEPAPCEISIPNFVTPNGDGSNDVFFIKNLEQYKNVKLQIFNRWGNNIYDSGDYGSANNYSFKDQPDGTYFYVLNVTGTDIIAKGYPNGYITVVREKK